MNKKTNKRKRLKAKIKSKIEGTASVPRLSVFKSNKFIYAQLIDDISGKTIAEANDMKITTGTKSDRAKKIGAEIAKKAVAKKITKVVFDRNGFKYTGRVKLVAEAAREGNLIF